MALKILMNGEISYSPIQLIIITGNQVIIFGPTGVLLELWATLSQAIN